MEARWSIRRLAGHYQVSYTTIHHRLAAAAIPLRPRGAPARRPPAAGKAAEDAARGG